MTRREQIEHEAKERFGFPLDMSFVGGAVWADEHPRKGMVDIEKVCDFLKAKAMKYFDVNWMQHEWYFERDQLIKDLHKAMEE